LSDHYHGRLELTWTNKDLRLLAHEDGSYAWVPPSDYRVAEVRLLQPADSAGDGDPGNLLIRGDALSALHALAQIPGYAERYVGQVKLAYLDPPFNTQQSFLHYDDALEHSVWLTMMRDRLMQVKRLLGPDGSVWVHCDDSEQAYLRVLMDEVFGRNRWITTVVWQTRTSRENRAAFGLAHNYLLVYSPAGPTGWREVRNRLGRGADTSANPDNDSRGPWDSVPFSAQGHRRNQMYEITTPTGVVHTPPRGRCWAATEPEFERLLADNRIYFTRRGDGPPRVKQFVTEAQGLVPMTWWSASEVGDSEEGKKEILELFADVEPFATPKPERLMQRIIEIATNPGELVLDCFAGSGTTAAVAHKTGRRWLTIERSRDTLAQFTLPRLRKVVDGDDPGGISEETGWTGGGGFEVLDVGPSMFEDDEGVIVLADWAYNTALSEATAAQLGFTYELISPFCGRKGRSRLAVIDGLISPQVIELLVGALAEEHQLTVCGTSIDEDAAQTLRDLRPGSRVRKIPASLLAEYQEATRWRPQSVAPEPAAPVAQP
jgi:adenine-specific DNA-methyltransferase